MLVVGAVRCVPTDRHEGQALFAGSDGFRFPAHVGQGKPVEDMELGIVGSGFQLCFEGDPGRVGIGPCLGLVPPHPPGLHLDRAPGGGIVEERRRGKPEQQLLFGVGQHPVEIVVGCEVGHQGRLRDGRGHRRKNGAGPGKVPLAQIHQHLGLNDIQSRRGQGERVLACDERLRVTPHGAEGPTELGGHPGRAGIELPGQLKMLERRVPFSQRALDHGGGRQ